jgi:hypothetical protein
MRADWLLTNRLGVSPRAVLAALITMALGTPYAYYACREPFMVHAVSAFWCTELVAVAASTLRGLLWFWPRLAFCGAMAVVCRPTNIHLVPVAIFGVLQVVRAAGLRQTLALLPLALVALIPVGLQVTAWRLLSGHWLYYSYGDESFDWTRPALWQTLFSSRHGLFFWSPILLVALAGLLRVRDRLIWSWMLGAAFLWYANSAWYCWWFGDAFGGRAFLELTALFGIGLALALERWCQQIWQMVLLASAAVAFNLGLMALYINHTIPRAGFLLPW